MSVKSLRNQLLAAIAMVLVAALALGSSTFAWFAVNSSVSATSMRVTAMTEKGLLINEVDTANDTHWDDLATAAKAAGSHVSLYPASTADGTTWYHAASKTTSNAAGATAANKKSDNLVGAAYETLPSLTAITAMSVDTATAGSEAVRQTMGKGADAEAGYYVHYTYYLKGSTGTPINDLGTDEGKMNVRIASVTATPSGNASTALNKSLRVGIRMKTSGKFYIISPIETTTTSYYVAAGATKTTVGTCGSGTEILTDLGALPAVGSAGTPVEVYIWYEGEDANCMSDNATAAALDEINVDIVFDLYTIPTTPSSGT